MCRFNYILCGVNDEYLQLVAAGVECFESLEDGAQNWGDGN